MVKPWRGNHGFVLDNWYKRKYIEGSSDKLPLHSGWEVDSADSESFWKYEELSTTSAMHAQSPSAAHPEIGYKRRLSGVPCQSAGFKRNFHPLFCCRAPLILCLATVSAQYQRTPCLKRYNVQISVHGLTCQSDSCVRNLRPLICGSISSTQCLTTAAAHRDWTP